MCFVIQINKNKIQSHLISLISMSVNLGIKKNRVRCKSDCCLLACDYRICPRADENMFSVIVFIAQSLDVCVMFVSCMFYDLLVAIYR